MRVVAIACAFISFLLAGSWAFVFLKVAVEGQVILIEPDLVILAAELIMAVLIMVWTGFVTGLFIRGESMQNGGAKT